MTDISDIYDTEEYLFEEDIVSLSPRLKWMINHSIETEEVRDDYWEAYTDDTVCTGPDEETALYKLAKRKGWRLWNEIL
jgi:hypothetical protein